LHVLTGLRLSYTRTVAVIHWGRYVLGPDNTVVQKEFSARNMKSTFLYILRVDELTKFV